MHLLGCCISILHAIDSLYVIMQGLWAVGVASALILAAKQVLRASVYMVTYC